MDVNAEFSNDLMNWRSGNVGPVNLGSGGTIEFLTAQSSISESGRYCRLRVDGDTTATCVVSAAIGTFQIS